MILIKKETILMKILDLAKRTQISNHYSIFKPFLDMNYSEIKAHQLARLNLLLKHAQCSVPYYKRLFSEIGFEPNGKTSFSDFKSITVLTRNHIHDNQDDLLSNIFKKNELLQASSSGTTGIPINYYIDRKDASAGVATGYILRGMSGWRLGMRNVHIWGNQTSIKRWNTYSSKAKNILLNQTNIASTKLNQVDGLKEVANLLLKLNPTSIDGYTSSIYTLAKYFKERNLKLKKLKVITTTAENLEDYQKELIEEVLAPVANLYGSGEVKGIALRPIHDNKFYVFDPHVLVETMDSGIPGMKDVLLTDLDNYGMPLIRYKIGDMIDEIYEPDSNSKYPFSWFKKIHGRSSDVISLPNGMKFHPVNIFGGTFFRRFSSITRHKVIWNGSMLTFMFETKNFNERRELIESLTDLLKPYQVEFTANFVDKIKPSESGKYKYMEIIN